MTVKIIKVKDKTVWLAIDQLKIYTSDEEMIERENEFLCYFKMTEPSLLVLGELFRDEDGRPKLFTSIDSAIEIAKFELNKRS